MRRWATALAAVGALGVLGGCSVHAGVTVGPQLSRAEVQRGASDALAKQVGRAPDGGIACPGDLAAKVGATMRCVLTDQGSRYGLTVTVTGLTGGNHADYTVQVDQQPIG